MTKYEGLQSKFLEWNNLHNHYGDKATLAMVGFFNGFQVYLDAPDKATRLCKVNYDFPDLDKYTPVDSPGKALSQTENNAWHFGIEVIFGAPGGIEFREVDDTRFTISLRGTAHLFFHIKIEIQKDGFVFRNANDSASPRVACKFDDTAETMIELYAYLAGLLESMLDLKPWDGSQKIPVGFESTRGA